MTGYRQSYHDAPALIGEVLELLATVFPGFREQERAARELGLRWEACSTPFVYRHHGRVVAHVGVLEVPLVMDGEEVTVGSVHGVATHPEYRRRSYYRAIMEELLPWCDARYPTLHLTTDNPEFFTPFGFRIVDEFRFEADVAGTPERRRAEPLPEPGTLHRLLAERDPVSHVLGTRDRNVFLFNEARHALHYAKDIDAVLSYDLVGERLVLMDVVATTMPSLAEITARVGGGFDHVEVHFAPDRLGAKLRAVPESTEEDVLMARGPYLPAGRAFKLPLTVRC